MTEATTGLGSRSVPTHDGLDVQVVDAVARSRFEAVVDGSVAAYAEYILRGDHIDFVHTATETGWEGRGIASALAQGALDLVRVGGRRAIPHCPFISAYLHRHSELTDLVDAEHRSLIRPASRS